MNLNIKSGLVACALAALSFQPVMAEESAEVQAAQPPKSYGYTVLAVGIGTPFSLPWDFNWDVFGLAANLGYSDYNKMYGWEFAVGANQARCDMYGLQTSAIFNYARQDAIGLQASLVNITKGDTIGITAGAFGMNSVFYGLQCNLLGSMTDRFYGLSIAGLCNYVSEDMWGWQVALGANYAESVHGFQTAVCNMTKELRGAQLGLFNYASTCTAGFQVGLVNLIMDNQIPFIPIINAYF